MSILPEHRLTEAEYLAWEAEQVEKHEFADGEIVAMSGVSLEHSAIVGNLFYALRRQLGEGPCRVHGSDLRVLLSETGMYAYPDLAVVCGPAELTGTRPPSLLNPVAIVEVLSESTESYDLGAKAAHYRRRASVSAIAFVDSRRRYVQVQARSVDGTWSLSEQESGSVRLAALGVDLALDEIYRDVRV